MRLAILLILILAGPVALAQLDPSSALLLNGRPRSSPKESGLDSGRYTVRPRAPSDGTSTDPKKKNAQAAGKTDPAESEQQDSSDGQSGAFVTLQPNIPPQQQQNQAPPQQAQGTGAQPSTTVEPVDKPEGMQEQFRDFFLGGSIEKIQRYRYVLHPEDSRLNLLEISAGPSFVYNQSDSSSWYRDYHSASPGFEVDAAVWLTPFFGIDTLYASTVGGDVYDSVDHKTYVEASHQWFRLGVKGRRYFGLLRTSPSVSFGIEYQEYQMQVPADATMRARLKTSGAVVSVEAELPTSIGHAWQFGFEILPAAKHQEIATGLALESGENNDTNAVGAWLGEKFKFNRANALYWKLKYSIEKTVFSGVANTPDPITGASYKGVPVTNAFTIFSIGYTWGN